MTAGFINLEIRTRNGLARFLMHFAIDIANRILRPPKESPCDAPPHTFKLRPDERGQCQGLVKTL